MDELISQVSEQLGVPDFLIERSARARAQAQGVDVEEVLQAWAGGEAVAAAPAEAPPGEEAPEEAAEAPPEPEEEVAEEPEPEEEVPEEPEPVPVPAAEEPEEVVVEEEEGAVLVTASAGLRERVLEGMPRWLMVAFLVIPAYALFYTLVYAGGPACGEAGRLAVDPETGRFLDCEGNPYTPEGGPAAGPGADFLAMGRGLYAASPGACASCHGAEGRGVGQNPALAGGAVLETFPSCETHLEWVSLGSQRWPDPTYGAQDKPVQGGMPTFENQLDEEQLAAVVLFERVEHGGESLDEALVDCGLAEPQQEVPADEQEGEDTEQTEGEQTDQEISGEDGGGE